MLKTNHIWWILLLVSFSLGLGCSGSGSSDGSGSLFSSGDAENQIDFSGTYSASNVWAGINSVIGTITNVTLSHYSNTVEGVDNLGNRYKGTLIQSNNKDSSGNLTGSGSTINMEASGTGIGAGTTITIIAAYDPEEINYVPGSSYTDSEYIRQSTSPTTWENFLKTTVITTTAQTTSYKTFIGEIVLSTGQSSNIILRGDVIVIGGDKTSKVTLTRTT